MILKGKVVNLLPTEKPNRAIILLEEWPESFSIPMPHLKIGQHIEIEINPLKVLSAVAGVPRPLRAPLAK